MRVLFLTNTRECFTSRAVHGVMRLSASIKQASHQCRLSELKEKNLRRDLEQFKPQVLAYSIMSCNSQSALEMNRTIKDDYPVISVFGGPHPTYFPEMINEQGVDAVCRGEGEIAFVDLLGRMEKGESWLRTPNFRTKENGVVYENPLRPLIDDLDSIPLPDHALFYDRFNDARVNAVKSFHTSRGCPYQCAYCYVSSHRDLYEGLGKRFRVRSVENLLEEIEGVKAIYPLDFLRFYSDVFFVKMDWLEEFAEKYSKRIALPFWCMITPTLVDQDVVALLKKAGCRSVSMGVEAGDEQVRKNILRRPVSDRAIHNALKLTCEAGIKTVTFNMLGIPGSTLRDDLKLLDLNMPYKISYAMATLMTPFPRTGIYEEAEKRGLLPEKQIEYDATIFKVSLLNIPDKKKVQRLQKLLGIVVRFKFLRPAVPLLLCLPLDGLYWFGYRLLMSYSYRFKVFPSKTPFSYNFRAFFQFMFGLELSEKKSHRQVEALRGSKMRKLSVKAD